MDRLFLLLSDIGDPCIGGADSFCDRLSNRYTVSILVIFSIMLTTRQYVGEPISCWCPPHFTSSMVDYTNKVRSGQVGGRLINNIIIVCFMRRIL